LGLSPWAYRELGVNPPPTPSNTARNFDDQVAQEMKANEPLLATYPAQSWIVGPLRVAALAQGRTDLVALWAGQSASLVRHRKADELFASLIRGTDELLEGRTPATSFNSTTN
jgi:nitronate monooxygenase